MNLKLHPSLLQTQFYLPRTTQTRTLKNSPNPIPISISQAPGTYDTAMTMLQAPMVSIGPRGPLGLVSEKNGHIWYFIFS